MEQAHCFSNQNSRPNWRLHKSATCFGCNRRSIGRRRRRHLIGKELFTLAGVIWSLSKRAKAILTNEASSSSGTTTANVVRGAYLYWFVLFDSSSTNARLQMPPFASHRLQIKSGLVFCEFRQESRCVTLPESSGSSLFRAS